MVSTSNTVYRVVRLNDNQFATANLATAATGAVDCEPFTLPVYAQSPSPAPTTAPSAPTSRSTAPRPTSSTVAASAEATPPASPSCSRAFSARTQSHRTSALPIPVHLERPGPRRSHNRALTSDTLYVAGQQLQPDGLFAGFLSTINLAAALTSPATAVTGQYSISDGTHTELLFADDNTLWIGSQSCATGERAKLKQNYNCLTRFDVGAKTAQIIPKVDPTPIPSPRSPLPTPIRTSTTTAALPASAGSRDFHKMYTAYGGQVHAFNTADGSEINNQFITVQGTALDVAYMDAVTNVAN